MRKKDREITDRSAMESILNGDGVCRVALADGCEPCVVPVCLGYEDNTICFYPALPERRSKCSQRTRAAASRWTVPTARSGAIIPAVGVMRYKSVICTGTARILEDYREKCAAMNCIIRHYGGPEYPFSKKRVERVCLVKIPLEGVTGKRYGY